MTLKGRTKVFALLSVPEHFQLSINTARAGGVTFRYPEKDKYFRGVTFMVPEKHKNFSGTTFK